MKNTSEPTPSASENVIVGAEVTQYRGRQRIRQVRVLEVHEQSATVEALNGPLAGTVYDTPLDNLA